MLQNKTYAVAWLLLVVILAIGVFASCQPSIDVPETPTPAAPTPEPPATEPSEPKTPEPPTPTPVAEKLDFWVNNQIILIGSKSAVSEVERAAALLPVPNAEPIDLGGLIVNDYIQSPDQTKNRESLPQLFQRAFGVGLNANQLNRISGGDLIAQLYEITKPELSVAEMIKQIDEIRARAQEDFDKGFIFAQPNYWTVPASAHTHTVCQSLGGAPHPHTIGGGAYGEPISGSLPISFAQQTALLQLTNNDLAELAKEPAGAGVRIVIFDSSPFSPAVAGVNFGDVKLDAVTNRPIQTQPISTTTDKVQHGLFVASLARAVAPLSTLELMRILDSNTCGQIYVLNGALQSLLLFEDKQTRMVINFSLVYRRGPAADPAADYLTTLLMDIGSSRLNTVLVAAAGNEGNGMPALYPAAYYTQEVVLAVASTNQTGAISCFSNDGSVSAMGGEGDAACAPSTHPDDNVIGETTSGYATWSGTSFAAPLVSGVAARCLSEGHDADAVMDHLDALGGIDAVRVGCPP